MNQAANARTPVAEFKKNGFTLAQVENYRSNLNMPHLLSGGDASCWFSQRTSEALYTSLLPMRLPVMPLDEAPMPEIGTIKTTTKNHGELSLNEWLAHPESYAKAFLAIHKGKVVFEQYPGLHQWEPHLWMSCAKPMTSLVIDHLIDEGKLDQNQTVGEIMPDWALTVWRDIKLIDILDMTPGTDTEENDDTRADPNSIA
ncbi:MAG: serine hydrolase, partial [Pseudomonadota bacterium]